MSGNDDEPVFDDTERKKELAKLVMTNMTRIKALVDLYNPAKFDLNILKIKEKDWLGKVEALYEEFLLQVGELALYLDENEEDKKEKEDMLKEVTKITQEFIVSYSMKAFSMGATTSGGEASISSSASNTSSNSQAAKTAKANVEIDHEKIAFEVENISKEIKKFSDWSDADSNEIELAMSRIPEWNKMFNKAMEHFYNMKKNVAAFDLDQEILVSSESAINTIEVKLEQVIDDIQFEDTDRQLFSQVRSKPANIAYPVFSGKDDEDFVKFEKDLRDAFKRNRDQKADQAKKLKENLRGHAKSIIPAKNDDIEECFEILRKMFADPSKLTKSRKDKLLALGPYPRFGSKAAGHVKQQVEWLLNVQLLLEDLFDLAEQNTDCHCEVYNTSTLRAIKNFFPAQIHSELLLDLKGTVKSQLEGILVHVEKLRVVQQELYKDVGGGDYGGNYSRVMACFIQGIKDYNKFEPPKLPGPMVTHEDLKFAMMSKDELADIVEDDDDEQEDDIEEIDDSGLGMTSLSCGVSVPEDLKSVLSVGKPWMSEFSITDASECDKVEPLKLVSIAKTQLTHAPVLLYPEVSDLEDDYANNMLPFMPEDEVLAIMTALHTKYEMEDSDGDSSH